MTDEQKAQVLSQINAEAWNSPEYKEMEKRSMEWEGSKEQAEFISRQFDAVLDVLVEADAWTSHEPWKGKTAAEQVKIFIERAALAEARLDKLLPQYVAQMAQLLMDNDTLRKSADDAVISLEVIEADNRDLEDAHRRIVELEKELAAVKRELTAAALWNDDSDKTTTPSVQVYVLHQKLLERADDCRDWDRRYEAAIKTLGIITQHRSELAALCERQAQQLAAQQVPVAQATAQKQPMPKPRIPVRPLPHNSGGKFDAKRSMEILSETVEDLVSAVNDLQRWACE